MADGGGGWGGGGLGGLSIMTWTDQSGPVHTVLRDKYKVSR